MPTVGALGFEAVGGTRGAKQEFVVMKSTRSRMTGALCAAVALVASAGVAEARIKCNGPFQVVRGAGEIATPYCEDEYLATVARGYGINVSGSAIRRSPSRKEEVCRAIGHDSRVYDICLKYREGRDRFRH